MLSKSEREILRKAIAKYQAKMMRIFSYLILVTLMFKMKPTSNEPAINFQIVSGRNFFHNEFSAASSLSVRKSFD